MWALGMVMSAWAAGSMGAQNVEAPAGTIEGIVYDSLLTRGPLRGATVYVIGTTLVATCLLYTSPSPRDLSTSRMPSSA